MASTQQLLRRINTAQNVSKTTRAMQMIAASKLKRAQEAALSSRPYVEKLNQVVRRLTTKVGKPIPEYMVERKHSGKTLVVFISPDKGLCGGLVSNLLREVLRRNRKDDMFLTVGKKAEGSISHLNENLIASFPFGNTLPSFDIVYPIVKLIDEYYLEKKVDKVELLTTHFVSTFVQKVHLTPLLPILPQNIEHENKKLSEYFSLFEPELETILPTLLKQYLEMIIYQEILESYLSEQAARMISMQNATNSAKDIIEDLRLEYNKSRQAKITSDILDITSAAIT